MKWRSGAASSLSLKLLKKFESRSTGSFFPPFLAAELLRSIHTFLFLLSDPGPFPNAKLRNSCTPTYVSPRLNSKGWPVYPPLPPRQPTFITVHNWNWRPLRFPYFERAQKEPLQLLMKGCREELKLSQESSRFVLEQSLIQFIMQGLCWSPSIR